MLEGWAGLQGLLLQEPCGNSPAAGTAGWAMLNAGSCLPAGCCWLTHSAWDQRSHTFSPLKTLACRDRFWRGDEESREALLPPRSREASGAASPRRDGYHTPPSRFQSPYTSPIRHLPTTGPLASAAQGVAPVAAS